MDYGQNFPCVVPKAIISLFSAALVWSQVTTSSGVWVQEAAVRMEAPVLLSCEEIPCFVSLLPEGG